MIIHWPTFIPKLAIALLLVFSFEEFIYGRLGLGGIGYLAAKTLTELLLYSLLGLILLWRIQNGTLLQYRPTLFDGALVAFVLLALISTKMNGGGLAQGLLNLRTMLRYVAVYYIIVFSAWQAQEWQIRRFLQVIIWIALFQVVICVAQNVGGEGFINNYFSPVKSEAAVGDVAIALNAMGQKLGAAIGTFGKTPALSLFLLVAAVVAITRFTMSTISERRKWFVIYLMIVLAIFLTYKRGPLLLALFAPLLVAWLSGQGRLIKKYMLLALIAMPMLVGLLLAVQPKEFVKEKDVEVSPLQSFSQLFTEEYWNRTNASARGWVIEEIGSEAISSFKPIGYGADEERARVLLARKGGTFSKLVGWGALDDVYVIAALVYYGPVGTVLLLTAFVFVYRQSSILARRASGEYRAVGIVVCALLILTFFASFLVRTLEFRAFAFMLWVFAGIVVVTSISLKREQNNIPKSAGLSVSNPAGFVGQ